MAGVASAAAASLTSKVIAHKPVRYKLGIQYNGTRFRGWQTQPEDSHTNPAQSTVQTIITKALEKIVNNKATIVIAGRTDAGVHAVENIAHVDITRAPKSPSKPLPAPFSPETLRIALNGALKSHHDLLITKIEVVDDSFHARFSASERSYNYRIISTPTGFGRPFDGYGRWFLRDQLDVDRMNEACSVLVGKHDFSSFRSSSDDSSPVRTLSDLHVVQESPHLLSGLSLDHFGARAVPIQYNITATAPSFMTHQVRKMVAVVANVGRGKIDANEVRRILEARDPSQCPTMAPAHGLFLTRITYPEHTIYDASSWTGEETS